MRVWDKQENEKYHEYFKRFVSLGRSRNMIRFYASINSDAFTINTWRKRSRDYDWKSRADAYDLYLLTEITEEIKYATNLKESDNLDLFRLVRTYSYDAVKALHKIVTKGEKEPAIIAAAKALIDMVGYVPPAAPEQTDAIMSDEDRRAFIDGLSREDRDQLNAINAKGAAAVAISRSKRMKEQ